MEFEANSLTEIFDLPDPTDIEFELGNHCYTKRRSLTHAEAVFEQLRQLGKWIAGDGFISVFNQFITPDSFGEICAAYTEVGALQLRDLLREAWSIYTKDKHPITLDELQNIPVRRFNTKEKMDRFDKIGNEVVTLLANQHPAAKIWSVEYARRHRDEFTPRA